MAKKKNSEDFDITNTPRFKRQLSNINNMISQANLSVYGTDNSNEVDSLNNKFKDILNTQINGFNKSDNEDVTSFLGRLVSSENKRSAINDMLANQFLSVGGGSGDDYSSVQSFIYEAYKNRLLEQSDLHEVASQLIELSEAILITRDAIISADVVEGRMSRSLNFHNINDDDASDTTEIVENMEKKFNLLTKIKNFIIPNTLEYGEYYVYVIPYSKLFDNFQTSKANDTTGRYIIRESTLMESFDDNSIRAPHKASNSDSDFQYFIEKAYTNYTAQEKTTYKENVEHVKESFVSKDEFTKDLTNMLGNISISNDSIPLPILEEGFDTIEYMREQYENLTTEADKSNNLFNKVSNAKMTADGITFDDPSFTKKHKNEFEDVGGCYIKMIEPTRIMPIKVMNTVVGYYYIQDEDITPLSGAISNTLYYSKFEEHRKEATVIDAIATRVVKSFNKKFLNNNQKFKELIVDCINYYNLNEKRLKFQFIPAEYIHAFKIDEDVDGNGQSMIKKSLFYAKLYLMLLLFKIMSIILYSNDQKVNYIKQSGIDKNVANKVQEIARIKQSRQVNITDLFSYTTLINKVGNGTELYIPTGRSGERPIETEILSGQDVQLNTELMEMLKNAYIMGTGVPAAIMNYMNEADFAKSIEQNNTKWNGRVVNYQLDFNPAITKMYQAIMKYSTNIPESVIDNFEFTLQPPKSNIINTKSEIISQFQTLSDFLVQILYEDPSQSMDAEDLVKEIREFRKVLAKDQLPMLNIDNAELIQKQAELNMMKNKLKPNPINGDNGDDDGLLDELNEEQP